MTHPFEMLFGSSTVNPLDTLFSADELYRGADKLVYRADMPGVDPDAIDIEVENGMLNISATREPFDAEGLQRVSRGILGGGSKHIFTARVGHSIDIEAVTAEYNAGVLTVTLPISEKAQARKVSVVSGSQS